MTLTKGNINLKKNKNDIAASVAKGTIGAIPFAGAALAEIVGSIIPNQRTDRVATYLEKLQTFFDEKSLEKIKALPEKIAIIEEGMFAAGLTPYQDRIDRITHVIANGLDQEEIKADKVSKILFAAKNISDFDAIILQSHALWGKDLNGHEPAFKFQKKHPQIWPSVKGSPFDKQSNQEEYQRSKEACEEARENVLSSERHLASLSLLKLYKPNIYFDETEGLKGSVERLSSALSEEEYCITDFGIRALEAMKQPKKVLAA